MLKRNHLGGAALLHFLYFFFYFQVNEVSRRLTEEEEANQALANSMRKMEADAKKMKEDVENMEEK